MSTVEPAPLPPPLEPARPGSHRGLLVVSCLLALMFVYLMGLLTNPSQRRDLFAMGWVTFATMAMGPLLLVAFLGGRRRWAYYLMSASLTVVAMRAVYSGILFLAVRFSGHLLELWWLISFELSCAGLVWLWWLVVWGRASRRYFGFERVSGGVGVE